MKTITKKDLVKKIHYEIGFSQRYLTKIVDDLLEEIKRALELNEKVKIVRFGVFVPYKTKEKIGRNLKTGEQIRLKPYKTVSLHLSSHFKAMLYNEKE